MLPTHFDVYHMLIPPPWRYPNNLSCKQKQRYTVSRTPEMNPHFFFKKNLLFINEHFNSFLVSCTENSSHSTSSSSRSISKIHWWIFHIIWFLERQRTQSTHNHTILNHFLVFIYLNRTKIYIAVVGLLAKVKSWPSYFRTRNPVGPWHGVENRQTHIRPSQLSKHRWILSNKKR